MASARDFMQGKVEDQISSMTRLRDALEYVVSSSDLKKGVLQVVSGIARGAVTFEDGLIIGARLTTGALSGRKAVEEMLRMDGVKLQLMPFMAARKTEQVWVNLRHLIANDWTLDGLVTDRPPAPEEEQREFVKVERAPEQTDVSTMVEAAFSGEELSQLRAALQESIKPTEEITKPELVSPTKATVEIPLVMLEQAMLKEETNIATSDDAFFDMEPKEEEVPPMTVPSAFRAAESEIQSEPQSETVTESAIESAPAQSPAPIAFPSIDFGSEEETYTQLPAAQPAAAEPAIAEPAAAEPAIAEPAAAEPAAAEPAAAEPAAAEPAAAEPAAAETAAAVDVVQALAPSEPVEEYIEPAWPEELIQEPAPEKPQFSYPSIDFDAPEEEPVPPPAVPAPEPELPNFIPEPEPQPLVPEPQPLFPEPQPQPLVPEQKPQPIVPEPLRPTAGGFFEPPLHAHTPPGASAPTLPPTPSLAPPVAPPPIPPLTPLPQKVDLESTISDAERWMRAQKAMSAPVQEQKEEFLQTNDSFNQSGFTPFQNAVAVSNEPRLEGELKKSALDEIPTPEVEDADFQPLIAMPEDAHGDQRRRTDKGIIDRAGNKQHDMGFFKRSVRRNLRQPERILTPLVFGCLVLGIFIFPGQLRKNLAADNNEQLADTQVEMTIAEETKQEIRYASTEADRPPVQAPAVANAGTGVYSKSGSRDEPGQTVVLRDDTALNQARRLSAGHKWNRIAYVMYREYLKKHPKDFEVRYEVIKYLMESKQTKEAKAECIAALTSGPSVEQSGAFSALYKRVQLMPMN